MNGEHETVCHPKGIRHSTSRHRGWNFCSLRAKTWLSTPRPSLVATLGLVGELTGNFLGGAFPPRLFGMMGAYPHKPLHFTCGGWHVVTSYFSFSKTSGTS